MVDNTILIASVIAMLLQWLDIACRRRFKLFFSTVSSFGRGRFIVVSFYLLAYTRKAFNNKAFIASVFLPAIPIQKNKH